MKAVISTTYDNKYLYYLPIVTYCWNKLGVGVICFMPKDYHGNDVISFSRKIDLQREITKSQGLDLDVQYFEAPQHKEATYAQCSRLYGACLDLPEDEILITSDVDMAVFQIPSNVLGTFSVFGYDLVPEGQVPMCYLTASVKQWRETFQLQYGQTSADAKSLMVIKTKTYQNCLDEILAHEEMENMRGNLWSRDQEIAWNKISSRVAYTAIKRARPGTQFASNRVDRDDSFWEERLNLDVIDSHLWRPGFTEENFPKILKLLKYFYPDDDFKWLVDYTKAYKQLL